MLSIIIRMPHSAQNFYYLRPRMMLESSPAANNWLAQFETVDREVARQLLRKLTPVSGSEFDVGLQGAIESIIKRIGKENIALFHIPEPPSVYDTEGVRRVKGSSADRVKHLLENLVRVHGNRVRANPTVLSMRADRIRNIILVEDFIGSGVRLAGYWKAGVGAADKSVKSWLSHGWTKIWVVSYAAIEDGIANVRRTIPKLARDSIITVLPAQAIGSQLTMPMVAIAQKYGERLRESMPLGFSGGGTTVVFQHGCPNNAPAILWANGPRFRALFPDRGIPSDLHAYFGRRNFLAVAENLWDHKQYKLALALNDHVTSKKGALEGEWEIVVALAIASRQRKWNDAELQQRLQLPLAKIVELRRQAYSMNLIDKQDHSVSPFGRELLNRLRKRNAPTTKGIRPLPNLHELYYPDTCGGVPKH